MIRKLAFGTTISVMAAAAQSAERVDVWVLLTEPPTASGAGAPELVRKQQQAVMAALQALGAVELGRVSLTRNAIAVSIDQAKLPEVKQLSGVRSVSPVRNIEREPPTPPVR